MTSVRSLPDEVAKSVLAWCIDNAEERPELVVAVGLCFVHGLSEHQIRAARIESVGPNVTLRRPQGRRDSDRGGPTRTLTLADPDWLAQAAKAMCKDASPGRRLFATRRQMQDVGAARIRTLVYEAGKDACGVVVTPAGLCATRTAWLAETNNPLAMFETGYAPSYAARLGMTAIFVRIPRRAA